MILNENRKLIKSQLVKSRVFADRIKTPINFTVNNKNSDLNCVRKTRNSIRKSIDSEISTKLYSVFLSVVYRKRQKMK